MTTDGPLALAYPAGDCPRTGWAGLIWHSRTRWMLSAGYEHVTPDTEPQTPLPAQRGLDYIWRVPPLPAAHMAVLVQALAQPVLTLAAALEETWDGEAWVGVLPGSQAVTDAQTEIERVLDPETLAEMSAEYLTG